MEGSRRWCRVGLFLSYAATAGCSEGPVFPVEAPEWPFDPSGTWTAEVTGSQGGAEVTSTLTITLVDDRYRCAACLGGSWEWAGSSGTLEAHWRFEQDQFADMPQCHTDPVLYCPLGMILLPPEPVVCSRPIESIYGVGYDEVRLRGMFRSETSFLATRLEGSYWEGAPGPWPCPGTEIVSFDTNLVLVKQ